MVSAGPSLPCNALVTNGLWEFPPVGGVGGGLGSAGRFPAGGSSSGGAGGGVTGPSCALGTEGIWRGGSTTVTTSVISRGGAGWEGESVVWVGFLASGGACGAGV
jgi:hypothetical protein